MFNPSHVFQVMQSASSMGAGSQSDLSAPFLEGMTNMQMSASEGSSAVIGHVSNACSDMMTRMNTMMKGLTDDVAAKHAEQMAAQPSDFDVKIQDLRPTSAKGFPSEMASFFSNLPK